MSNKNQNQPITKEDLGNMLHKYINPLYEKTDKLERGLEGVKQELNGVKQDVGGIKQELNGVKQDVGGIKQELNEAKQERNDLGKKIDKIEGIQLRMENKLVDDNKLLHDRDDAHDKKLKDHEGRLLSLEKRP